MDDLLRLVMMFVAESRAAQRAGIDASRMTTGVLCTGCAMISVIAGIACGVAALWIYLVPIIGSAGAALTAAGIFLVLSGTLMFVARNMFRPAPEALADKAEPVVDEIVDLLRDGFERHKGASLLAALVAGLAAGSSGNR
jgi:hypothetical protein